jgi:hypothetical protein
MSRLRFRRASALWAWIAAGTVCAPISAQEQPTGLKALHRAGQTFLTWREPDPVVTDASLSMADLRKFAQESEKNRKIRYHVYRSDRPITSINGLTPVAEVPPLSVWNFDFYGAEGHADQPALRYVIEEGESPLLPGAGLCVHNPRQAGDGYYAVTVSVDGRENKAVNSGNSLESSVQETVGRGDPVLQRVEHPQLSITSNLRRCISTSAGKSRRIAASPASPSITSSPCRPNWRIPPRSAFICIAGAAT